MDTSNTREILSAESGECKEISQVPSLSEEHKSSRVDIRLGGVINNVERGVQWSFRIKDTMGPI